MTQQKFQSLSIILQAKMELVNKKNVTSPIWQFFGFKPDAKGEPEDITQASVCKRISNDKPVRTFAYSPPH